jgi:hypothetical protein
LSDPGRDGRVVAERERGQHRRHVGVARTGGVDRPCRLALQVQRLVARCRQPATVGARADYRQPAVAQPPDQGGRGLRRALATGERGRLPGAQAQQVGAAEHPLQPAGGDVGDQRAGVDGQQQVLTESGQPRVQRSAPRPGEQVVAGDVDGVAGPQRQPSQVVQRQAGLDARRRHEGPLAIRLDQPNDHARVATRVVRQQRLDAGPVQRLLGQHAERPRAGAAAIGRLHAQPGSGQEHVEARARARQQLARQQVATALRQPVDVHQHVHHHAADQDGPPRPYPHARHPARTLPERRASANAPARPWPGGSLRPARRGARAVLSRLSGPAQARAGGPACRLVAELAEHRRRQLAERLALGKRWGWEAGELVVARPDGRKLAAPGSSGTEAAAGCGWVGDVGVHVARHTAATFCCSRACRCGW